MNASSVAAEALPFTPAEEAAIEALLRWHDDPVAFVREALGVEPDDWQLEALQAAGRGDLRIGLSACKGPGKSAVLAWIVIWFVVTRVDAQVIVTSITGDNLQDGLWKEIALWFGKAPELASQFEFGKQRITSKARPATWWISARKWAQDADSTQQSNTIAGFHGQHVMVALDEMGDYPDGLVVAAEAIFANTEVEGQEARLVAAWNPTRTDGPAYRVTTRDRHRWTIIHITGDPDDPKRSKRISREWAQQQIDDWGRENDWVRVNVLGLFPKRASNKLLSADDCEKALGRDVPPGMIRDLPSVWGLDVARFGDDESVLRERVGPVAFRPLRWRGLDGVELAQRVSYHLNLSKRPPDYLVVDVTGVGSSVVDHLRHLGWGNIVVPVDFGSAPEDPRFDMLRSELWWKMADWTRKSACLPRDSGPLVSQLTAPAFEYRAFGKRTVFRLESKDDLKKRGLPSPDEADALALTFVPTRPVKRSVDDRAYERGATGGKAVDALNYDPLKGGE